MKKFKYHSHLSKISAGSIIEYVISREEVEDGETERLIHDLRITEDNPIAKAGPGSVIFRVDGYDDDARELWQIPEFLRFVRQVEECSPCWLYFAAPDSYWVSTIVAATLPLRTFDAADGSGKFQSFSTADVELWITGQIPGFERLSTFAGLSLRQMGKAFERAARILIRGA